MEISEVTGLPELPEGYFWRVTARYNHYTGEFAGLYVALMRREKRWWGGHSEYEIMGDAERLEAGRNTVVVTAEAVYRRWQCARERVQYVGDYPPKTTNN